MFTGSMQTDPRPQWSRINEWKWETSLLSCIMWQYWSVLNCDCFIWGVKQLSPQCPCAHHRHLYTDILSQNEPWCENTTCTHEVFRHVFSVLVMTQYMDPIWERKWPHVIHLAAVQSMFLSFDVSGMHHTLPWISIGAISFLGVQRREKNVKT